MRPLHLGSDHCFSAELVLSSKEPELKSYPGGQKVLPRNTFKPRYKEDTSPKMQGVARHMSASVGSMEHILVIEQPTRDFQCDFYENFNHRSYKVLTSTNENLCFQAAKMSRTLFIKSSACPVVLLTLLLHRSISRSAY